MSQTGEEGEDEANVEQQLQHFTENTLRLKKRYTQITHQGQQLLLQLRELQSTGETHTHTHTCTCTHKHTHTHTHTHTHRHIDTHTHRHTHTNTQAHTHTHTHTYTQTHTQTDRHTHTHEEYAEECLVTPVIMMFIGECCLLLWELK